MQQNCNDIFMTRKKELQIFKNLPTTKKNLTDTMFTETNIHKLYYYKITLKYTFDLISRCMWYGNLLAIFFLISWSQKLAFI